MMKAWLEGEVSNRYRINSGTPQGGVLSPLLFNVMLSDLPKHHEIEALVYADDITIACCGEDIQEVRSIMQGYLNEFSEWTEMWGLRINLNKTFIQHYTKKRVPCPVVRIQNRALDYKKEQTILGMVFDSPSLTWKEHIKRLRVDCLRRIDLMKVISSTNWGISTKILRSFYLYNIPF